MGGVSTLFMTASLTREAHHRFPGLLPWLTVGFLVQKSNSRRPRPLHVPGTPSWWRRSDRGKREVMFWKAAGSYALKELDLNHLPSPPV